MIENDVICRHCDNINLPTVVKNNEKFNLTCFNLKKKDFALTVN